MNSLSELAARRDALLRERLSWEADWKLLARHFLPRKCRLEQTGRSNEGGLRGGVLDSTGILAMRDLAAGLHGGMTSPARPWFRLGLEDHDLAAYKPARDWMDEVERRMRSILHRSNFYNAIHHVYAEMGAFGTAFMFAMANEESCVRFVPLTVGEYCLDTDEHGRVDTVFRTVDMSLRQIVQAFPAHRLPDWMRELARKSAHWNQRFPVVHAVFPRGERGASPLPTDMPFASVYYLEQGGNSRSGNPCVLRESGFSSFPGFGPRWDVTGMDVYGRSPGMDVLPDSVLLQQMVSSMLQALHKEINPPMVAPEDMKNINLLPGGANFVNSTAGAQAVYPAVQIRHNIQGTQQAISAVRDQVREGLFNNLFRMLLNSDRRQITAREVAAREEEKLILIGPVLERLHDELFIPLISRVFALMGEADCLPEAPEPLQGQPLRVEFVSILAQAQKLAATSAVEQFAGFVGQGSRLFPEMLDAIDPDKVVDSYAEYLGVETRLLRGQEERDSLRSARREAEAAQAAMQTAMAGLDAAGKAGNAASELAASGLDVAAMLGGA